MEIAADNGEGIIMPGFDGEISELTPQKREERERQEQKKREQDILLPKKKTGWEIIFFSV